MDDMNDTQHSGPTGPGPDPAATGSSTSDGAGTDDRFEPRRLRTITDMRRSRSDALLGGVCTGAARYLNIDPVILRIAFAALTFIGGAGLILYLAAWFFLPPEDGPHGPGTSVAAEWFNLDENEERVRVGGLVVAGVVAALSVVGDSGWGWGFPWWIFPIGVLALAFVVLRNRRHDHDDSPAYEPPVTSDQGTPDYTHPDYVRALTQAKTERILQAKLARAQEPRSNALLVLTLSVTAIAVAVTRLVSEAHGGVLWPTYVAVALAVVGAGLVVSTFFGDGGPLIGIGILLACVLAVGSMIPSVRIGEQVVRPESAAQVEPNYVHGIGKLEIDLTDVDNPAALLGRTVQIDSGIGETRVIVPSGLDVAVDTELRAGEIRVFDRKTNGTRADLDVPATGARHLTLDIEHRIGTIEVIRK